VNLKVTDGSWNLARVVLGKMKDFILLCLIGLGLLAEGFSTPSSESCSASNCTVCLRDKKCTYIVGKEDAVCTPKEKKVQGIRYKAVTISKCKFAEQMQASVNNKESGLPFDSTLVPVEEPKVQIGKANEYTPGPLDQKMISNKEEGERKQQEKKKVFNNVQQSRATQHSHALHTTGKETRVQLISANYSIINSSYFSNNTPNNVFVKNNQTAAIKQFNGALNASRVPHASPPEPILINVTQSNKGAKKINEQNSTLFNEGIDHVNNSRARARTNEEMKKQMITRPMRRQAGRKEKRENNLFPYSTFFKFDCRVSHCK